MLGVTMAKSSETKPMRFAGGYGRLARWPRVVEGTFPLGSTFVLPLHSYVMDFVQGSRWSYVNEREGETATE